MKNVNFLHKRNGSFSREDRNLKVIFEGSALGMVCLILSTFVSRLFEVRLNLPNPIIICFTLAYI